MLVLHGYQVLICDGYAPEWTLLCPQNTRSDGHLEPVPSLCAPPPPPAVPPTHLLQHILSGLSKVTLAGDFRGNFWMK